MQKLLVIARDGEGAHATLGDMLAVQVVFEARQAGLEVSLEELFAHQTVAALAGRRSTSMVPTEPAVLVPVEQARDLARSLLEAAGLPPEGAALVAEVQLESSLRGQPTHNLGDLPRYVRRLRAGVLNGDPDLRFVRRTDSFALLDGDNGPGQWVACVAMETALDMAGRTGRALVAVRRSNHLGAIGHYAWLAAQRGMIGLCTSNGPLILAPTGGVTPSLGNNPIAVGIPLPGRPPLLLDMALSTAPRGRIGKHVAEGRPLPEGWILDRRGRPSTRLEDLVAGLGVPIGAHKGYGLALVMEILAGVMTGAGFGSDHRRRERHDAGSPSDIGHLFAVLDPGQLMPGPERDERLARLIAEIKASERAPGVDEIWLPGEQELIARERSLREGVTLSASAYRALRRCAGELGLNVNHPGQPARG
jgi:LDH2 family malate/lactate/ureidoglycolate dehydrogenase